jgi:hypothetical protein
MPRPRSRPSVASRTETRSPGGAPALSPQPSPPAILTPVRGLRHVFAVLACLGAICLWAPAGALAAGCHGSAGDNQYVDPLQHCNHPGSGHSGGSGGGSGGSTTTSTPTTVTTPTSTTATTASSTSTTTSGAKSKDPSSGKTLPFTGLDLVPAMIVALALIGGGLALRRLTGETSA